MDPEQILRKRFSLDDQSDRDFLAKLALSDPSNAKVLDDLRLFKATAGVLVGDDPELKAMKIDRDAMTVEAVISTVNEDREGDIIRQDGWDLSAYLRNPVVLWVHNYYQPPIARSVKLKEQKTRLISKNEFYDSDFAAEIFDMYASGFMAAWSVGFNPHSYQARFDERERFLGFDFMAQELMEHSAVPVPANAEALSLSQDPNLRKLYPLTGGPGSCYDKNTDAPSGRVTTGTEPGTSEARKLRAEILDAVADLATVARLARIRSMLDDI